MSDASVVRPPAVDVLDGRPSDRYRLRLQEAEPFTDDDRSAWATYLRDTFILLVEFGGLCGVDGVPGGGGFVGDVDFREVPGALDVDLGPVLVDVGAVTVLRNLCEWGAVDLPGIRRAEIRVPFDPQVVRSRGRRYPGRSRALGFAVDDAGAGQSGTSLDATITFCAPPTGTAVARYLDPWLDTLANGGFAHAALPTIEQVVLLGDPPVTMHDAHLFVRIEDFAADFAAVDALCNCVGRMHRDGHAVASVTIE
jgi:hypothetical protein